MAPNNIGISVVRQLDCSILASLLIAFRRSVAIFGTGLIEQDLVVLRKPFSSAGFEATEQGVLKNVVLAFRIRFWEYEIGRNAVFFGCWSP